ncbi:peroxidase family protein, partial [Hydrogenophaga sp.]|uniref:peroxidase family protein n=1 Tax=Hydrogenophaga sp. TaxID=1904254 RepID=UPI003AF6D77A
MITLTPRDVLQLQALVAGLAVPGSVTGVRDLSGLNNNISDPTFGTAGTPFLRLTTASYGAPIYNDAGVVTQLDTNPIFAGLDARGISNVVGVQDINTPVQAAGANMLFSAFGQYFDHGLAASMKGGSGTLQIGAPGTGRTPGTDNPADLTRTTVAGFDAAGVPLHINNTSAFIDQNQAYGANLLVGTFLRATDGLGGVGAKLAVGAPDPSNPAFDQIPTLRALIHAHWENNTVFNMGAGTVTFRDYYDGLVSDAGEIDLTIATSLYKDFMGSGQPIFVDLNPFISPLDHAVGGDGRANENITLTAIHTIWARNHNMHVDSLVSAGFEGSAEALFQAAKIINETEYQRVIYTDFADILLGGMQGSGSHGHDEYFPRVDAGISQEFNAAAYRFGHSMVGQTVQILDAANQMQSIRLFDAFLNPGNDVEFTRSLAELERFGYVPQPGYAQIGTNSIIAGITAQAAEEVDTQVVDAIRNDLVRVSADLFSLNVARGRDLGMGTLNQVRQALLDSQDVYVVDSIKRSDVDLTPYTSWENFQIRNSLSDATIAKFRAAYPDLVLTDAQQIADFQRYNPGVQLVNGNTVQGVDRIDLWVGGIAESHVNGGVVGGTFWVIIHEQLDRLQEADRFYYFDRVKDFDFYEAVKNIGFAGIVARTTGIDYTDNIFLVTQPPGLALPLAPDVPIDEVAPTVAVFMPEAGTVDVAVASPIVVRFSEVVRASIGVIELRLGSATGELVESFDTVSSTRLLFVDNTLTVDPTVDLLPGQIYVLVIPAGAVMDQAGNEYLDPTPLQFATLA